MTIRNGDKVKIHYTAKLDKKTIETTRDKEPLSFKLGSKTVLPGLEEGLVGLKKGEKKEITVPPKKGFGERSENLLKEVPLSAFNEKPTPGAVFEIKMKDGSRTFATIQEVKKESVILDHNHPLAGKTLKFDVEVVGIEHPPHYL